MKIALFMNKLSCLLLMDMMYSILYQMFLLTIYILYIVENGYAELKFELLRSMLCSNLFESMKTRLRSLIDQVGHSTGQSIMLKDTQSEREQMVKDFANRFV